MFPNAFLWAVLLYVLVSLYAHLSTVSSLLPSTSETSRAHQSILSGIASRQ